jgi:predicted short-subunit dehydrogenase-like oxidoreductase (DUF2520 family)
VSTEELRIAILGAGRAGSSLFRALDASGLSPTLWTRRAATAITARAEGLPVSWGALPDLSLFDVVFLAVDDAAVGSLASELAQQPLSSRPLLVHLAGALDLSPLTPWKDAGGATGSFHPILSIATRRTPLNGAVALDASPAEAGTPLQMIAERLGLVIIRPTGDRARYHAGAAIVGNFPQVLMEAAIRLLSGCGLTQDEVRAAFGPLLESAAINAVDLGPVEGLTGPAARGDVETLRRHLGAVAGLPEVDGLYRAATRIAIELAEARGAGGVEAMEALLLEEDPEKPEKGSAP